MVAFTPSPSLPENTLEINLRPRSDRDQSCLRCTRVRDQPSRVAPLLFLDVKRRKTQGEEVVACKRVSDATPI